MTTAERNAIAQPSTGLQVYNLDDHCIDIYNGSSWLQNCSNIATDSIPETLWEFHGDMNIPGSFTLTNKSVSIDGHIYAFINNMQNIFLWKYNPVTNTSSPIVLPSGDNTEFNSLFTAGGKLFVLQFPSDELFELDVVNETWNSKGFAPFSEIQQLSSFSTNSSKAYIGFGFIWDPNIADFVSSDEFWEYDADNNSWLQLADFNGTNFFGDKTWFEKDGYIYLKGENQDFYRYDTSLDTWTSLSDFPIAKTDAIGYSFRGKRYIGFGSESGITSVSIHKYDENNDTWESHPDFNLSPIDCKFAHEINDILYVSDPSGYAFKLDLSFYSLLRNGYGETIWKEEIDEDTDPSNELQNLSDVLSLDNDASGLRINNLASPISGQDAATKSYVDNNDSVDDADADPNNEIQNLSFANKVIALTGSSTTVDLSDYLISNTPATFTFGPGYSNYAVAAGYEATSYYFQGDHVCLTGLVQKTSAVGPQDLIGIITDPAFRPTKRVIRSVQQGINQVRFDIIPIAGGATELRVWDIADNIDTDRDWVNISGICYRKDN